MNRKDLRNQTAPCVKEFGTNCLTLSATSSYVGRPVLRPRKRRFYDILTRVRIVLGPGMIDPHSDDEEAHDPSAPGVRGRADLRAGKGGVVAVMLTCGT